MLVSGAGERCIPCKARLALLFGRELDEGDDVRFLYGAGKRPARSG